MEKFQEIVTLVELDIDSMLDEIFKLQSVKREVIELNQDEQLAEGKDALDQKIITISATEQGAGNVYSWQSIHERRAQSLQTRNVDLNFTGSFWDTMRVKEVRGGWAVVALWEMYGDDIRNHFENKYDFLGLTPENLEYLVFNTIIPELDKLIKKQYKL